MIQYEFILQIVTKFYESATHDILIGYHFRRIHNFSEHLPRIADFWEFQLKGKEHMLHPQSLPFALLPLHRPLKIKTGEINRWAQLFKETLNSFDMEEDLKKLWLNRLQHFQEIFLGSRQRGEL